MIKATAIEGTEVSDVQDFGVLNIQQPVKLVDAALRYADELTAMGQRVKAIKFLRWQFNVGLKEAHRLMVSLERDRKAQADEDTMVCDYCGWEGPDEGRSFCPSCGCSI